MNEKEFEGFFRSSLGLEFPGRHRIRKHHADEYSGAGHPDFYGHICGLGVEFELKVRPNRPTEVQVTQLIETVRTGGNAFVAILDGDKVLLIHGAILLAGFSYRKQDGWLALPIVEYPTQKGHGRRIDFTMLRAVLGLSNK